MRSKLEKLIAAYEAERLNLSTEREECVAELDYERAHSFSKALRRVDQQLQTLYNLRDKWHDEKEHLGDSIKHWEAKMLGEQGYMRRYLTERVAEAKQELAELNLVSTQEVTVGHTVRDVLSKLLTGEITGFTLVLHQANQLNCHIRLVKKTLILTLSEVRRHRDSYMIKEKDINFFKRLGFQLYDNKDKLMLFAPYSAEEHVKVVQLLLARITFDIFYFKEFAGETFIKYHA
jgi:small-conductance mechanosensitive channel